MTPTLPSSGKAGAFSQPTPETFFREWQTVCEVNFRRLLDNWENGGHYSSVIFGEKEHSVIASVAKKFRLDCYFNYYALDAVCFHRPVDAVEMPTAPADSTWLQNIRVAFEHENYFRSGLFQEVSHLAITRAGLRVLVTYPEACAAEQENQELDRLSRIIDRSGLSDPAFLLITGKRTRKGREDWSGIQWTGRKYTPKGWTEIAPT